MLVLYLFKSIATFERFKFTHVTSCMYANLPVQVMIDLLTSETVWLIGLKLYMHFPDKKINTDIKVKLVPSYTKVIQLHCDWDVWSWFLNVYNNA